MAVNVVFSRIIVIVSRVAIYGFCVCVVGTKGNMTMLVISDNVFIGSHKLGVTNVMDTCP